MHRVTLLSELVTACVTRHVRAPQCLADTYVSCTVSRTAAKDTGDSMQTIIRHVSGQHWVIGSRAETSTSISRLPCSVCPSQLASRTLAASLLVTHPASHAATHAREPPEPSSSLPFPLL